MNEYESFKHFTSLPFASQEPQASVFLLCHIRYTIYMLKGAVYKLSYCLVMLYIWCLCCHSVNDGKGQFDFVLVSMLTWRATQSESRGAPPTLS